ncbi:MAG: nucleotide pyrophosphatase/phosphodiesterase family protein [Microbacteriaceae bacterium]
MSLADVLPSCLSAAQGQQNPLGLAAVRRAVVILVDGLGVAALRARAGHARFLSARLTKASTLYSGFPTTTVAGIGSLCTGVAPGEHGLVAYRVLDRANDRTVNQLTGWDSEMDPATWQLAETVFDKAAGQGIGSWSVGPARYRDSGFTQAVLRGSDYVGAESIADRFDAATELLQRIDRGLIYVYVPELDIAAHAHGCESEQWLAALEELDARVSSFARRLRSGEGAWVTADHGILDVPASSQVLFDTVPELVAGVRHVGGDPRCVHLYLDDSSLEETAADEARERLAADWRDVEGERSWVATRTEACAAGWFGPVVAPGVLPRIGDVLVAARARIAYYDSRIPGSKARSMIGQHGSFSAEETRVPLIGLGAFDRS